LACLLGFRGSPGLVDHFDAGSRPENPDDGSGELLAMALLDPGADVRRRGDVEDVAGAVGELERLEPDVEGEVRYVFAQLATDVIPQVLELFGHGSVTALRGGLWRLHMA